MNQTCELLHLLSEKKQTLAVAESCTGGGLAAAITAQAGISRVFLGSITAYANAAKIKLLQVDPQTLEKYGAVSEEIALQMAKNCREILGATWALATTGIAGPSGGTEEKPVGTVWISICGPNILEAHRFVFGGLTRLEHRHVTVSTALNLALKFQY